MLSPHVRLKCPMTEDGPSFLHPKCTMEVLLPSHCGASDLHPLAHKPQTSSIAAASHQDRLIHHEGVLIAFGGSRMGAPKENANQMA